MTRKILIISQADDAHIPFVSKHLPEMPIIIDPSDAARGTELSYEFKDGKLSIVFDGQLVEGIGSVWYRKPLALREEYLPKVDPRFRTYSETAIQTHVREFYVHLQDAFWMSDYYSIRRADYKGLQQEVASELGFQIPDTIATSSAKAARRFIDNHSATIVKSPAEAFPQTESGEATMFFSRIILPNQDFDLSGLHLAPAIFQQAIDHDRELRVTVVGKKVFAASISITDKNKSDIRDWRPSALTDDVEIKPFELPHDIEKNCVELIRRLGLKFGAIDLIIDKKGAYWFLENNPNGQWAFIEIKTGQPIGKAIADALLAGSAELN
jgi:glutathione synthase/RimK-type ligase-like ATP-grasp enzyme